METEKQLLQNAADQIGLTIYEAGQHDQRKTIKKYFACQGIKGVSPTLNYDKMNHFLLGWINCTKNNQL